VEKQKEEESAVCECAIFKIQYRPLQAEIQQTLQGTDSFFKVGS